MTGGAEGVPIKVYSSNCTKDAGGVCCVCHKRADVKVYYTDKGILKFCPECDKQDDDRRYGRDGQA